MATPAFFTAALSTALEQGQATAQDLLAFVTPDVLSVHLPRPLWTRLLTSSLGAPALSPAEVVDTLGIPNLCEHVPAPILWRCLATIASRSLDGAVAAPADRPSGRSGRTAPPPPAVSAPPPSAASSAGSAAAPTPGASASPPPIMPPSPAAVRAQADAEVDSALESLELGDEPRGYRPPSLSSSRPSAGASSRRPQRRSVAPEAPAATAAPDESTRASAREIDVLDEQLVEWSANDEPKGGTT